MGDGPCVLCNNNSIQDNGETGVDCGGGGCPACGGGGCPAVPLPPFTTCFLADTKVRMADGSEKNIQDVQIGDVLKGEKSDNAVLEFDRPKMHGKAYSFNGGRFFVTEEHPLMTTEGWKSINPEMTASENTGLEVTELKIGDTLVTENGNVKLESIDSKDMPSDTLLYNFKLSGDHTYYADGYLAHNKVLCDIENGPGCSGPPCISGGYAIITGSGTCATACSTGPFCPDWSCPDGCGYCPGESCGDGVVNGLEQCDLGAGNNGICPSSCSTVCAFNTCSCNNNNIQDNGEAGVDCGGGGCPPCGVCGDGNINPGEQCDPPDGGITCDSNCLNVTSCYLFPGNYALCPGGECCVPDPGHQGFEMCTTTCTGCIDDGDCDDGNACTADVCFGGSCQHNSSAVCVPANQASTPCGNPSIDSCGNLNAACPGSQGCGGSGNPECWDCFNTSGTGQGNFCYSDGTAGQTNACTSACALPYNLPAQVPMYYCVDCGPVTASYGPLGNICSTVFDLYYASPATGFQVGNHVFTDSACTTPINGTGIRAGGGEVFNMINGNEIGPSTGNTC